MSNKKNISNLENFEFQPSGKVWNGIARNLSNPNVSNKSESDNLNNFEFEPSSKVWDKLNTHLENTTISANSPELSFYKYAFIASLAVILFLSSVILINYNSVENEKLDFSEIITTKNSNNANINNENTFSENENLPIVHNKKTVVAESSEHKELKKINNTKTNKDFTNKNLLNNSVKESIQENAKSEIKFGLKEKGFVEKPNKKVSNSNFDVFNDAFVQNYDLLTPSISNSNIKDKPEINNLNDFDKKTKNKVVTNNKNFQKNKLIELKEVIALNPVKSLVDFDNFKYINIKKRESYPLNSINFQEKGFLNNKNEYSLSYNIGKWWNTPSNEVASKQQYFQQITLKHWWRLNKFLSFGTGISNINYSSTQNQDITFNLDGRNFDEVTLLSALAENMVKAYLPTSSGVGAGSQINYNISSIEKAHYIAVPLSLKFGVLFNKINVNTQLGISPIYLRKHLISLSPLEQRLDRVEIQSSNINRFNILGNFTLGFGYNISHKMNIEIQTNINKKLIAGDSNFKNIPFGIGGGVKVGYNF